MSCDAVNFRKLNKINPDVQFEDNRNGTTPGCLGGDDTVTVNGTTYNLDGNDYNFGDSQENYPVYRTLNIYAANLGFANPHPYSNFTKMLNFLSQSYGVEFSNTIAVSRPSVGSDTTFQAPPPSNTETFTIRKDGVAITTLTLEKPIENSVYSLASQLETALRKANALPPLTYTLSDNAKALGLEVIEKNPGEFFLKLSNNQEKSLNGEVGALNRKVEISIFENDNGENVVYIKTFEFNGAIKAYQLTLDENSYFSEVACFPNFWTFEN